MKRIAISLAAIATIIPLSANSTTPFPWVGDFSRCTGKEADARLAGSAKPLSRSEARAMVDKIFEACTWTMPPDMTADQRADWLKSIRNDEAKRLRHYSRHRLGG
ncbi:hypothetical protein [Sphingopyxis sp.]|jgi:hypothetical protein|uniref:hypothetical protein n=1 Tax=Sphingopyxis sp. TaxID=1908224 RepID=UPI002DE51E08|nr:hypothetical protein [Sphingopyxis sp.]